MEREQPRQEMERIRWWHRIELGDGLVTPGEDDPRPTLKRIRLPGSLAGKSVLDVGAWDGCFSFEAERRGASRVLATDSFCWGGEGWGSRAGFDLARAALGSRVQDREIDVLDLSPAAIGMSDVVLLLGVLDHMRRPLLALERVASVTGERLILDAQVDMLWSRRPALAFYPGRDLSDDETNWFGPNPAAVIGMLRCAGLRKVLMVSGP